MLESSDKERAFHRLIAALRISQNATDMMEEAFAGLLGVNRTDARCLDIVQRLGRISAGELASHSGLTTGAVTSVIDRLEGAGYLERTRDKMDRRKVFVELTQATKQLGEIVYAELSEVGHGEMAQMSQTDMELVGKFLRTGAFVNQSMAGLLSQFNPQPGSEMADRMLAARKFAAAVHDRVDLIREDIFAVWHDEDPDDRSGKPGG